MTHQELAHQVSTTLGDHIKDYDIDAIVTDLLDEHGPIDTIDDIDSDAYWATVEKHDTTTGAESVVWSVVRGESPTARAVEPGIAGATVPDEILTWAESHGLSMDDPDVYLLVTPEDEAGEVTGEIAYTTVQAPKADVAAIRAAL